MEIEGVVERIRRVAGVRVNAAAPRVDVESALCDVRQVRAWLDASEAALASSLADQASFPEAAIAETSRGSIGDASRTLDRSRTLSATPPLATALDDGAITSGHVDAVTRAGSSLDEHQRAELYDRCSTLVDVAERATTEQWGRRVRDEARRIVADDGMSRLEQQRRATSLRTWVDADGMWNLRGRFDPVTGVRLAARLDAAVDTLFAERAPATCPTDPIEKQHHLWALALDRLLDGSAGGARPGRAEFVVVIDTSDAPAGPLEACDRAAAPHVQFPIPVEVPWRVLAELAGDAEVSAVVVRNGVVLHAPGELNLGRTTRLANRAQRRALRGMYATCAIPGCSTAYDRCKLHHLVWWRHGGATDLDNLLPVCSHHHTKIHNDAWQLCLGPGRELTVTFPDGTVRCTGPPRRRAA